MISRILLGLVYFVFGLNGFYNFLHIPMPHMSPQAMGYFQGLMGTGYFMPLLGATQVIGGALLITGIAAPLALVILAPVTLQIFLFHVFLTPEIKMLVLPIFMSIFHIIAAAAYWPLYRPLFFKGSSCN